MLICGACGDADESKGIGSLGKMMHAGKLRVQKKEVKLVCACMLVRARVCGGVCVSMCAPELPSALLWLVLSPLPVLANSDNSPEPPPPAHVPLRLRQRVVPL